ncbi:MAG: gamma-glutamyl-gamma-aminobutyrate hydrolase family protein, partial [Actinobacteria bacterium]|nr:gamma-glutamyl-gamma-aminobutyrate hydrolase family protein [Actinomycetota bacterium]
MTAPAARASGRCAIIGLSTSEMRAPERVRHDPHSEPAGRELALNLTYPEAIRRAGAIPIVIPP